ncbi:MAG: Crp/Fnr family transcriptional regulator [Saprospiraceae bacterium]|nr:Crp/Fnr family transcriptional regulator [Saprospiraceae bacterium]
MDKEKIILALNNLFPQLMGGGLAESIAEKAAILEIPAGKVIMEPGDTIKVIPFVLKGSIKVARADADGHEILLYYIQPGESCAITLSSCLKQHKSAIKAVTQQTTLLIGLPSDQAYMLGRKYPAWLDFVLESYANRFNELLHTVDEIGFSSLDHRLMRYLKDKSELLGTLIPHISHQEIADDLGTARTVISRLLKQMERKGMVKLARGRIRIVSLPDF